MKHIVFDIGNVLTDFRIKEFLMEKGFDGAMIKRILKASVLSPYWEEFERGIMTEEEAFAAFASLDPEIEQELHRAYDDCKGMLTLRSFAIQWVRELKDAGYGVYYLSNYSSKAYKDCSDSLAFMTYMDGGVLSFEAKMTKPNPIIYKYFLEKYDLQASDCIFIDDTEENVETAKTLGFQGIVFFGYEDARQKLKKLLA